MCKLKNKLILQNLSIIFLLLHLDKLLAQLLYILDNYLYRVTKTNISYSFFIFENNIQNLELLVQYELEQVEKELYSLIF